MSDYNITKLHTTEEYDTYGVRFKSTPDGTMITGAQAVAQQFTKILLTTPGTDLFDKNLGAGLSRYLRYGNYEVEDSMFKLEVSRMIMKASEQCIKYQTGFTIPDSERFLSATLLGIERVDNETGATIRIKLETVSGNVLDVSIPPTNRNRLWPPDEF